jgi:transposase
VGQFERIRRDYFVAGRSIRWIARMHGVHRRTVRQAIKQAWPSVRRTSQREPKVLTEPMRQAVQAWLQADEQAPPKQRHTGRRIYRRLAKELGYTGAESTVRVHVGRLRRERGLGREVFVPQVHAPGVEAEVDWYEAAVDFPGGRQTVPIFVMRACASGRAFHIAYPRLTHASIPQQAFLEAHVAAFEHFGGIFARLRYDNLTAAVKQVLKGRRRAQSDRFVALRSHYLFEAVFCRPGLQGAHEKGGVEGEVGRFRREHLVPVPAASGPSIPQDRLRVTQSLSLPVLFGR